MDGSLWRFWRRCPCRLQHSRNRRSPAWRRTLPVRCCRASRWRPRARPSSRRSVRSPPMAAVRTASWTCRSGTYTVTFTLAGFNTLKREGHRAHRRLHGPSVKRTAAPRLASRRDHRHGREPDRRRAGLEGPEDHRQHDDCRDSPRRRQEFSFTALTPGLNHPGLRCGWLPQGPTFSIFQAHGGRRQRGPWCRWTARRWRSSASPSTSPTLGASQEVAVTVTGGMGEAVTGGPIFNVVSRSGGNTFSGSLFA